MRYLQDYLNKEMKRTFIVLLSILLIINYTNQLPVHKTQLLDNWNLQVLSGAANSASLHDKKFNTSIPTTLHLDLFAHKQIQDPFAKDNWNNQRWISQSNVRYSTTFKIDPNTLKYKNHRLVFQGIDTYGTVILNGKTVLKTQNAFRQYSVLVNQYLKADQNTLQVEIKSPKQIDGQGQRTDPMPFQYAHTRKACYQYSWDWAPYVMTSGIWKKVYIQSFQQLQINYVWARNRFISQKKVIVNFAVALDAPQTIQSNYYLIVKLDNKIVGKTLKPIKQKNAYVDVQILQPKLWWPNGIGSPHIYDFTVQLQNQSKQTIDSRNIPYGIRSVKLEQKDNQFTVVVNGYPIYAKGANYVPMDMFYPRLTNKNYNSANTIQKLLQDTVDSHFNMIRLWGGGQYQSDQFLQLASRKGIMIFYDFMFSDSIYPSSQKFLVNVEEQIKQQVRRARNYPCLAFWSGNNQILQGVNDWGWGSQKYKDDYKKLFEVLIKKVVQIQTPEISYIPSSPVNGVGNYGFQRGGDFHFWGVWAAGSPFETYADAVGPFNSQFGTQAFPVWQTVTQMADEQERKYQSPILLAHERHSSRFSTIQMYINQYMRKSLNFELQVYQTGLLQAYAIGFAIKHQRGAKPKSMGTLYWQLNDAWPGISWSSIDYFGRWKPLQYEAKRLYPDIAIFHTKDGITVVNDKLYAVEVLAVIQLITFNGEYLVNQTQKVKLQANEVKRLAIDIKKSIGRQKQVVLYTQVVGGRKQVMTSTHFFQKFKQLQLPNGQLNVQYHPQYKQITLWSDKLLKNVYISNSKQYIKLTDNYFDLVPGHKIKVQVLNSQTSLDKLIQTMVYKSYYQVYNSEPLKVNVIKS